MAYAIHVVNQFLAKGCSDSACFLDRVFEGLGKESKSILLTTNHQTYLIVNILRRKLCQGIMYALCGGLEIVKERLKSADLEHTKDLSDSLDILGRDISQPQER